VRAKFAFTSLSSVVTGGLLQGRHFGGEGWWSLFRYRYSAEPAAASTDRSRALGERRPRPWRNELKSARLSAASLQKEEHIMQSMDELFHGLLQDVYFAEKQLLKALPKLAKNSADQRLKEALAHHREETEGQVERLTKVFEAIGKRPRGKSCDAILGIIAEGQEMIDEVDDKALRDAGIVAAAQAAEHYEIARYGTLRAWARLLGMKDVEELLAQTLAEEKHADELLTSIADGGVNENAMERSQAAE
jgi:ferritin-like metal-binding protein YciE